MDKDMRAKIVGKARADADFRARLLSDPKGAIAQELGVAMPASLSVEVHEETATTAHLIVAAAGSSRRRTPHHMSRQGGLTRPRGEA